MMKQQSLLFMRLDIKWRAIYFNLFAVSQGMVMTSQGMVMTSQGLMAVASHPGQMNQTMHHSPQSPQPAAYPMQPGQMDQVRN